MKPIRISSRSFVGICASLLLGLAGCGGGGSGDGGNDTGGSGSSSGDAPNPGTPPPANTFFVAYTVDNLSGSGLQIALDRQQPGQPMLLVETDDIVADGSFMFNTQVVAGDGYRVRVLTQPVSPSEECVIDQSDGTVGNANVTNVQVRCPLDVHKAWDMDGDTGVDDPALARTGTAADVEVDDAFEPQYPEGTISAGAAGPVQPLPTDIIDDVFAPTGTNMRAYANDDGHSVWIGTQNGTFPPLDEDVGRQTNTSMKTVWWFRKTAPVARFRVQLSHMHMFSVVDGLSRRYPVANGAVLAYAGASTEVNANAYSPATGLVPVPVHSQGMYFFLMRQWWDETPTGWTASYEHVLNGSHTQFPVPSGELPGGMRLADLSAGFGYRHAEVSNNYPLVMDVNLNQITEGQVVRIEVQSGVDALLNRTSSEGSVVSFLRDPAEFDPAQQNGGVSVIEVTGLTLVHPEAEPPNFEPEEFEPPMAPPCGPNSPLASILQLDQSTYHAEERNPLFLSVMRTGATLGEVSARVTFSAGTASAGDDFIERSVTVNFGDGVDGSARVNIPVLDDDLVEGPETVLVTLDEISGCAVAGGVDSAVITIDDEDGPPLTSDYTIGGMVTGLVGSGLVIETLSDQLAITSNGQFQFARNFASGYIYVVRVISQPLNPRQACTVTGGDGRVNDANVTGIQIQCATLPEAGGLDPLFGTGGRAWNSGMVVQPFSTKMARQADGKLLVVGGNANLLRLMPDGTPDTSFGLAGNGMVSVPSGRNDDFNLSAVAVQPDGRIVVAGAATIGVTGRADFLVARFNVDGTLDAGFAGGAGFATFDYALWQDGASQVLLQPDGSILLTGGLSDVNGNGDSSDFAALRLTSLGQVDTTYGTNGWARSNVAGGYDVSRTAALTPDGGVVLVGRVGPSGGSNGDVGIVKFNALGVPDASFGASGTGIVRPFTAEHDEARDIVVMPDGSLLVVGERDLPSVPGYAYELWLARYLPNGQLDPAFGTGGVATLTTHMRGYAVAVQLDGTVWVAGETPSPDGSSADFGVARFTAAGQPDANYGTGGLLAVDLFGGFDVPGAMLLLPDGNVVVAGSAPNGVTGGLGLVRLSP
jgi:uncharacterized delta-60 repeat protein